MFTLNPNLLITMRGVNKGYKPLRDGPVVLFAGCTSSCKGGCKSMCRGRCKGTRRGK
jgi:hypothetical protein